MGKRKTEHVEDVGPLYTLKFAARLFKCDVSTVRRWCAAQKMGVQPGGRRSFWMLTRADIVGKIGASAAKEVLR